MSQIYFYEKQTIPYVWKLVIIVFTIALTAFIFFMVYLTEWDTMPEGDKWAMLTLLLIPVSILPVLILKLELRLTSTAVEFKVLPFSRKNKIIPYSEMKEISFSPAKGMKKLQGMGYHQQINRTEYNFGGKYMLKITLRKRKRQLVFTTFKPLEMKDFLRNLPEEIPVVINES